MLTIRPNCELGDHDLPPDATDAMICSYECTYCATCVREHLKNVCPTCGGGFAPRPIRPKNNWRLRGKPLGLIAHPASPNRVHRVLSDAEIHGQIARPLDIDPRSR